MEIIHKPQESKPPMNLLDFPPELLQLILCDCTTASYLQTLLTCRALFNIGSTSRQVVLHHFLQTPGIQFLDDDGTNDAGDNNDNTHTNNHSHSHIHTQPTLKLFNLIRSKASSLLYGAEHNSEITQHKLNDGGIIDARASSISPVVAASTRILAPAGCPKIALVRKGGESVYLYNVQPNSESLELQDVLTAPYEYPGKVEIIKAVIPRSYDIHIAVLQRKEKPVPAPPASTPVTAAAATDQASDSRSSSPDSNSHLGQLLPFESEALKPFFNGGLHVVHYRYGQFTRVFSDVSFSVFPEFWALNYTPVAIDVASEDLVVVLWEDNRRPGLKYTVLHRYTKGNPLERKRVKYFEYDSSLVLATNYYQPNNLTPPPPLPSNPVPSNYMSKYNITRIAFNDKATQMLYYGSTAVIYGGFQLLTQNRPDVGPRTISSNRCFLRPPLTDLDLDLIQTPNSSPTPQSPNADFTPACAFNIDIPFFGTHASFTNEHNEPMCHWKYLALGIAKDPVRQNRRITCLFRAEAKCRSFRCGHVLNLDRGRRFNDWLLVGRLRGYRESHSSIPGVVAAPACGTRLAIANWKTLYIWVLEPGEIIEENKSGYYPESKLVDHRGEKPRTGDGNTNTNTNTSTNTSTNANPNNTNNTNGTNVPDPNTTSDNDNDDDEPEPTPGKVVQLEPLIIHLDAVCFSLKFILGSADELLILTDKGLMKLKLSPKGTGARVEKVLDPEEEKEELFARRGPIECDSDDGDGDGVIRRGGTDFDEDDDEDEDDEDEDEDGMDIDEDEDDSDEEL